MLTSQIRHKKSLKLCGVSPVRLKPREGSEQRSREKCKARTKAGGPCQAPAVEGDLCFCHAHPERLADLGRQGGLRNRRWRVETDGLPYSSLKTIDEVCDLLEETINRVRQGPFDLRAANTIALLAGIHLKALSQRTESPETSDREASGGVYTSLFQRLGSAAPEEEVFDLFPQPKQQDETSIPARLPAPGESPDDPPEWSPGHLGIITVDVG
jgi:hypothetical protein